MTDTEVRINGRNAGDIHSGGFYRFGYDVTGLLAYGKENTLEVKVRKCPSDTSVYGAERQTDFWLSAAFTVRSILKSAPLTI